MGLKNKNVDKERFSGKRLKRYSTISDKELDPIYTPEDIADFDYNDKLGIPGEYPFTRGVYDTMYRERLWTMRQFSGFGTAEETNKRYKYLLSHGQTGLSVAFHMPTIMGYDSDHPRSAGEVGKCGVAIDTLKDMEVLFDGIPLDKITTSMTINAPAIVLFSMYIAVAEKQGVSPKVISGTIQNDILKEYIAQKSWIYPPEPSMRIITDIFEYCSKYVPRWNTISISGYHIREAGSTAVQELAFTLADGIAYVKAGIERGLDVDGFTPRLSFFFDAHNDFFEEIAKFRAARRMWARIMKERFNAKKEESLRLRFHTQTAGCSLVAQQPMNNIVRVAIQALASVLGGTQSLHTNSMDETLALPTEQAVTVALRTQQIIAEESGIANVIDPLGGSYFMEKLTNEIEEDAWNYINKIDQMGGIIPAIEKGYPQMEIADAAYRYQRQIENSHKVVVGVNKYKMKEKETIPTLMISPEVEQNQIERTRAIKNKRNNNKVKTALDRLSIGAKGNDNLMPFVLDAVKAYASIGEIMDVMRAVFGEYRDPALF
jgi:methylmalonyl-CoA mutase N-terminal domain/subunit